MKYEAVEWKRISGRIRSALCSLGVTVAVCSGSAVAAEPKQANNGPVIRVLLDETSGTITLPLEEYLRGVVPSEIGARAPDEAKKAQTVAARSFALLALKNPHHAKEKCDVCDTVHCQVYKPEKVAQSTDGAVSATRGLVLTYKGKPMAAYYSSMCGGYSEDIRNVWPERRGELAYPGTARTDGELERQLDLTNEKTFRGWLASSPDVYCNPEKHTVADWAAKNFRWTRQFTADELTSFAATRRNIGRVLEIRPGARGVSGRITNLEVVGTKGKLRLVSQLDIRKFFEPMLRSSAFVIETSGPVHLPTHFVIKGAGSGHGVGMCQTGAMGMANAGKSFREILDHYYPRAALKQMY